MRSSAIDVDLSKHGKGHVKHGADEVVDGSLIAGLLSKKLVAGKACRCGARVDGVRTRGRATGLQNLDERIARLTKHCKSSRPVLFVDALKIFIHVRKTALRRGVHYQRYLSLGKVSDADLAPLDVYCVEVIDRSDRPSRRRRQVPIQKDGSNYDKGGDQRDEDGARGHSAASSRCAKVAQGPRSGSSCFKVQSSEN